MEKSIADCVPSKSVGEGIWLKAEINASGDEKPPEDGFDVEGVEGDGSVRYALSGIANSWIGLPWSTEILQSSYRAWTSLWALTLLASCLAFSYAAMALIVASSTAADVAFDRDCHLPAEFSIPDSMIAERA